MTEQIKLTNALIEAYFAAAPDLDMMVDKVARKIQRSKELSPELEAKIKAEADAAASKHGFKDFSEYIAVGENISLIVGTIDPDTGTFTDPVDAVMQDIEQVKADKSIKASDRKAMLKELNEALADTQPIEFQGNIDLVRKHLKKIYAMV